MKRLFFLLAAFTAIISCTKDKTYSINGTVGYEGCEGADAILYYNGETDTTSVKDNRFSFSGKFVEPEVALIVLRDTSMRNMYCYFVLEPCTLNVEVSRQSFCTGGTLNEANNVYQHAVRERAYKRSDDLKAIRNNAEMSDEEKAVATNKIWEDYYAWTSAFDSKIFSEHPDDILGSDAMMSLNKSKAVFDSLYAIAGENVRNSRAVAKEKQRYANIAATAVGSMFVDFSVPAGTAEGGKVSLSDYVGKGKYILVDFWASWCAPCRAEIPVIAKAYEKFKSDKFDVLGVAVWDKREDTEKILPSLPISWPIIYDAQKEPTAIYGIKGIPHLILFGPDGTILARGFEGDEIEPVLSQFLK